MREHICPDEFRTKVAPALTLPPPPARPRHHAPRETLPAVTRAITARHHPRQPHQQRRRASHTARSVAKALSSAPSYPKIATHPSFHLSSTLPPIHSTRSQPFTTFPLFLHSSTLQYPSHPSPTIPPMLHLSTHASPFHPSFTLPRRPPPFHPTTLPSFSTTTGVPCRGPQQPPFFHQFSVLAGLPHINISGFLQSPGRRFKITVACPRRSQMQHDGLSTATGQGNKAESL